jgi:hypothetical protein
VSSSVDLRRDELCRLAAAAAARKGHAIIEWSADRSQDDSERHGTCRACGRPVYVRVGKGMTGMSGTALTEPCG